MKFWRKIQLFDWLSTIAAQLGRISAVFTVAVICIMKLKGGAHSSIFYYSRIFHLIDCRYFIATHMKPTYFRTVCPSYDEPSFKALFSLTIYHSSLFNSISNMPQTVSPKWVFTQFWAFISWLRFISENVFSGPGRVRTVYNQTPLLPTYLVAFVISDFSVNEKTSVNNIRFRGRGGLMVDAFSEIIFSLLKAFSIQFSCH